MPLLVTEAKRIKETTLQYGFTVSCEIYLIQRLMYQKHMEVALLVLIFPRVLMMEVMRYKFYTTTVVTMIVCAVIKTENFNVDVT
jgi:hypothetical protein